jgi:septum formation protein
MLILASASPRRRELLAQAGFTFEVRPAHVDEDVRAGEDAVAYVVRLAREKAAAVFAELMLPTGKPGEAGPSTPLRSAQDDKVIALGADTTVVVDGMILGKPRDAEDAARMLRMLSGRTHRVITGVAVVGAGGVEVAAEVTAVRFRSLSDEEIAAYIATGEPMDKAGGYAIQGMAARWIPRIEGDYFNVVGLPISLVATMLEGLDGVG